MSTTYDSANGLFQTARGQVGVYADGAAGVRPAESWSDLMTAPSHR